MLSAEQKISYNGIIAHIFSVKFFDCLLGLLNLGLLEARHLSLLVARPALDGNGTFVEFHVFSGISGLFSENYENFRILSTL